MENGGRQEHCGSGIRSRDVRSHLLHQDNGVGIERAYNMAADAFKRALAVCVGFDLTNRGIRRHHTHKEAHQDKDPQMQV